MRHFTIVISFLFFSIITQGQKTYVDSSVYENGQLENKGLYYQVDKHSWQWGVWDYWYEDGKKKLELLSDTTKTRYINMWLPNGTQILKSGNGYYYSIEPDSDKDDSLVYQIKDSIKSGEFKRFRSYTNKPYFLIETGFYENEKETGIWQFRDTVLKTRIVSTYKNGEQNGLEIHYYLDGKLKDSVNFLNGRENGNYKAFSQKGLLIKDCNYKGGNLIDNYKEYYANGQLKLQGQYTQGNGYIKVSIISIGRSKNRIRTENRFRKDKPLKQGTWKYFSDKGQLQRTEKYLNDKRV
jgi:antitoxin component YwqK of YwqJK toxin-antitoxin module